MSHRCLCGEYLPCCFTEKALTFRLASCVRFCIYFRTVSIETCYQNIGIATSVAISMFSGEDRTMAMSVPLFYGIVEAVLIGSYCIFAWKKGWTKAPKDESICKILGNSYEVEESIKEQYYAEGSDDATSTEMTPPRSPDLHQRKPSLESPIPPPEVLASVSTQANADIDEAFRTHGQDVIDEELKPPSWIV